MRKSKKLLAALTAAAMAFSLCAAQVSAEPTTFEVIGGGEVNYITTDDEEILITMPTALNWSFLVDPQGLGQLQVGDIFTPGQLGKSAQTIQRLKEDGETYEDVTLDLSPNLIFKSAGAAIVSSQSSVNVKLGVTIEGTGTDADFVGTAAAANAANKVFVQVVASTKDYGLMAADEKFSGTIGRAAKKGTAAQMDFFIDACEYVCEVETLDPFAYDFRLKAPTQKHGTILYPTGAISSTANLDWSALVGENKVGLKVNFSADKTTDTKPTAGATAGSLTTGTYGLIVPTTTTDNIVNDPAIANIALEPPTPPAPSVGFASETGVGTAGQWSSFSFGLGESTITKVVSNGTTLTKGTNWDYDENTKKLSIKVSAGTRTVVVTMADKSTHTIVVTVS